MEIEEEIPALAPPIVVLGWVREENGDEAGSSTGGRELGHEAADDDVEMEKEVVENGEDDDDDTDGKSSGDCDAEWVSGADSGDEDSLEEGEVTSSVSENGRDGDPTGDPELRKRRKKKKKKKKKKTAKDGDLNQFAAIDSNMLFSEVADKRYSACLESMRNDSSLLWMQLNRCRITDKRARKLFSALKDNNSLTSLDLSENHLTDDSIQFLFGVLSGGSAPNLIYVDIRGNPITSKSQEILDHLHNLRKHLKVDYDLNSSGDGENEVSSADVNWSEGYPREKLMDGATESGSALTQEDAAVSNQLKMSNPQALQEKIESALLAIKRCSLKLDVRELTSSLRAIIINFSQQLYHYRGQNNDWTTKDKLPEGLSFLLDNFGMFMSVLEMSPNPIMCQRRVEEQSAGMHRIALVELLNLLLVPTSPCIETELLEKGVPGRIVGLFFQFPWNSVIQGAAFRSLQGMLSKPRLICPLLEGGNNLATRLAKTGMDCGSLPMGRRPGYTGYIVKLTVEVQSLVDKDVDAKFLLDMNDDWKKYVGPGGAFRKMLGEQTGHLGGPKPAVMRSSGSSFFQSEGSRTFSTLEQLRGLFLPYVLEKGARPHFSYWEVLGTTGRWRGSSFSITRISDPENLTTSGII
ncbi:hypothetical protein R1sor_021836 [Riccia sorocarpa]|uniref:Uncharacterized protein n=1 Tax=Riccia sorocarpa TaxID=122646 RepID=A0ABD3GLG7_9MARC